MQFIGENRERYTLVHDRRGFYSHRKNPGLAYRLWES